MSCIEFTSWNELPQCKKLGFAQLEDDSNYVLSISNLQDHLPNLGPAGEFTNFLRYKTEVCRGLRSNFETKRVVLAYIIK